MIIPPRTTARPKRPRPPPRSPRPPVGARRGDSLVALTITPAQHVAAHLLAYHARIRYARRLRYLTTAVLAVGVLWLLLAVGVYMDLLPGAAVLLALVLTVA